MNYKLIGAVCIILGCSSCGFMIASRYLMKIRLLQNLIGALDFMECELQYRCTPLPQLCRQAGEQSQGVIQKIFILLADELEAQISPDAYRCMASVLDRLGDVEGVIHTVLLELGRNMGKFDIPGQLRGLAYTRDVCREKLAQMTQNKDARMRSYQTLGLCAGAAIAILFV